MTDVAPSRALHAVFADVRRSLRAVPTAFRVRDERANDVAARETLLDTCFGPSRLLKTCERLRESRFAATDLSFVATSGTDVVATLRFWHVEAGDREGLMLGPLAVSPTLRAAGIGRALIEHGLRRARKLGHAAVILVGDAPYYERFGFTRALTRGLLLPGPVDADRFLGLELVQGALAGAQGRVVGTGVFLDARLQGEYGKAA